MTWTVAIARCWSVECRECSSDSAQLTGSLSQRASCWCTSHHISTSLLSSSLTPFPPLPLVLHRAQPHSPASPAPALSSDNCAVIDKFQSCGFHAVYLKPGPAWPLLNWSTDNKLTHYLHSVGQTTTWILSYDCGWLHLAVVVSPLAVMSKYVTNSMKSLRSFSFCSKLLLLLCWLVLCLSHVWVSECLQQAAYISCVSVDDVSWQWARH